MTTPVNNQDRFVHIDAMRAAAVLLVVLMHSGWSFFPGDSGVTVFFAISGFIITFILLKERDRSGGFRPSRFYQRRVLKLAPPFLLIVAIPTLIYAVLTPISWTAFLSQVFFSFNWTEIYLPVEARATLPGSSVVWSLAVEEQFYIVFSLVWIAMVGRRWWHTGLVAISGLAIVTSFAVRLATAVSEPMHAMRGTDARMEAIAWGVLAAAALYAHRRGSVPWLGVLAKDAILPLAVIIYLSAFLVPDGWAELVFRPTLWAIAAVLVILYGMLPGDSKARKAFFSIVSFKPIQIVGLASYSIYLVHFELRYLITTVAGDSLSLTTQRIIFIVAGVAVGITIYLAVERPIARLSGRRAKTQRPPSAVADPIAQEAPRS